MPVHSWRKSRPVPCWESRRTATAYPMEEKWSRVEKSLLRRISENSKSQNTKKLFNKRTKSTQYIPIVKSNAQHSINQSINRAINQSINQSINPSINQSIDQSINQSINQSIDQSINQSINPSINQFQETNLTKVKIFHVHASSSGRQSA